MSHQVAVTIVADVRPGEADSLKRLLATMGAGVANGSVVDLSALRGVHFARFVLLDETHDLRGDPLPASLVYMSDVDIAADRHLSDLVDTVGSGLDLLFGHCDGYPAAPTARDARLSYLRSHLVKEQARYFNTTGRNVRRVRQEAELRDRIEDVLNSSPDSLTDADPASIRARVQEQIAHDGRLSWARRPASGPGLGFRLKELAHLVGGLLLVVLLSPLLLVVAPVFVVLLRLHERSEPAPHLRPERKHVEELEALEDHLVQNPFTAVGFVKPGLFRLMTIKTILLAIDFAARHVFNKGNLAGVKTIHSARWVALNGWRRMVFASNYDGSRESYMDDFVDKIAWGLNVAFGSGYGFPRTRWLFFDGVRDEQAFKDFLRRHLAPTRVWYSAYGRLTNANIENNARIRAGLTGKADANEARRWVQAL